MIRVSSLRHAPEETVSANAAPDDDAGGPVSEAIEDAERAFLRSWVERLVADALREVETVCREKRQQSHFEIFLAYYFAKVGAELSWEELAKRFELKDGRTARNRAATVLAHFRPILAKMLLQEGQPEGDLVSEVREVLAILGDDDA